jgi:hypothetical protein
MAIHMGTWQAWRIGGELVSATLRKGGGYSILHAGKKTMQINGGIAAVFQNIQGNGLRLILRNPANVVNLTGHQIEAVVKRLKESRSVRSWIEQG